MPQHEVTKNRQMAINIISSLVVFGVNLIINFFLSPYIVENLGVEANGFISLANTFISYATLVTIALNSMAGRFITIAIHRGDYETANKYYNAVFLGNIVITILLLFPAILCIINLESIINISPQLVVDVKFLFSILFLNFFINTTLPNWATATFATNKLYLQSQRDIEANLLKVFIIWILFAILSPRVYYIAIATIVSTLYTTFFAYYYKRKLLNRLKINIKYFDKDALFELIGSGIWNTINKAGLILLSGLDLLITNLFIGPIEMGVLSLAKTTPTVITNLSGTLTSVFMPALTIDYAKGDQEALKMNLKKGMKLTGILLTIPIALLIVYGQEFYSLWMPSQDARVLQILSILTCFSLVFTSSTQCLYNIFTVVNKLKVNSILVIISGLVSTIIVFVLLRTTNLGIFAVAGVSSVVTLIRNMIYTVPFSAKYLNFKWYTFFPEVFSSIICVLVITLVGLIIKNMCIIDSWITLSTIVGITGVIGIALNIMIVLKKEERRYLYRIIMSKIKKYI